jgi:hypothetical protein
MTLLKKRGPLSRIYEGFNLPSLIFATVHFSMMFQEDVLHNLKNYLKAVIDNRRPIGVNSLNVDP